MWCLTALLSLALAGVSLNVSPRVTQEPATIKFLLMGLENNRTACFELAPVSEQGGYYWGCNDVEGRKSFQREFKDVSYGSYVARAYVDDKVTPFYSVVVTNQGPDQ